MIFRSKKISLFYRLGVFFCLGGLLWPACTAKKSPDAEVVAQIGDRQIDWQLLWRSYHLNPKWGKGITHLQAFENQLNFLIDQKLFAQAAYADQLDQEPEVANYLQFLKEKEMIKELYRQEVSARVEISDQEYQTAYRHSKRKVQLAFISTPDSGQARIYLEKLQSSPLEQIQLSRLETEQKGVTPRFTFGDLVPELEAFVFDMAPGQVHGPVRIDGKYLVVKLVDYSEEKFSSDSDFAEQKSKIRKIISERKSRSISDSFIYELLKDQDIQIQPAAFWRLSEQFEGIVKEKISEQPIPVYLADPELHQTSVNLSDLKNQVLVTFPDGNITIGEFLTKLAHLPAGLRPRVKFAPQLKKAIAIVVRNEYLAKRAAQKHLDRVPEVQKELKIQSDEFLARVWLQKLQKKMTIAPAEMEDFKNGKIYQTLTDQFKRTLSEPLLSDILMDYKFTQAKIRAADSLRAIYPVSLDTLFLRSKIDQPKQLIAENPMSFFYRELFQ